MKILKPHFIYLWCMIPVQAFIVLGHLWSDLKKKKEKNAKLYNQRIWFWIPHVHESVYEPNAFSFSLSISVCVCAWVFNWIKFRDCVYISFSQVERKMRATIVFFGNRNGKWVKRIERRKQPKKNKTEKKKKTKNRTHFLLAIIFFYSPAHTH